jgi:hypothetical protein
VDLGPGHGADMRADPPRLQVENGFGHLPSPPQNLDDDVGVQEDAG